MSTQDSTARAQEYDVVLTRLLDAPRARVFHAWTDAEYLLRWWAPRGFTTPYCKTDLRVGGVFHYCMRTADGQDIWGRGVYREIIKPERIVYSDSFADAQGNMVPPAHYGMGPGIPPETLVTVTFAERDGMTELTLCHSAFESAKDRAEIMQGWGEMLDRLALELTKG
jgi:uncharacterized protein YndB with AHSA1/START domain